MVKEYPYSTACEGDGRERATVEELVTFSLHPKIDIIFPASAKTVL